MDEQKKQLPGQWTPQQLKMMELLASPFDDRTIAEKAEEVGVSERTVYNWKNLPGWRDGIYDLAKTYIGDRVPKVLKALCQRAQTGDFACIKLYLEVIGKYIPKQETDLKVGRLEQLSDAELRDIIQKGASSESGGGNGNGEKAKGESHTVLPAPSEAGEVSQEQSDN